jgi:SAM-dependent methyltransferase
MILKQPVPIPAAGPQRSNPRSVPAGHSCPLCFASGSTEVLAGTAKTLMKCPACGVAYLHPWPSQREIISYFSSSYITTVADVEIRFGTKQQESLRRVAGFIKSRKCRGRILDVGCAGGHFLDWFFPKSDWETWGVELSQMAGEAAQKKEIRVHIGDIHSAVLPASSFDVVTALDTFYYFPDPRRELNRIRELLKPDGLLVLVLVSAAGHIWRHTGWVSQFLGDKEASILTSSHLLFYDTGSIAYVLRESGFRVTDTLPWPATGQRRLWRAMLFRGYFAVSALVWHLSASRLMLAPRFLVAATPDSSQLSGP